MAETYGPFDAPAGDPRNWTQASWYDFAPLWAPSGVVGAPATSYSTGNLPLIVNGSAVSLGVGKAWVRGAGYKNDASKTLTAPDGSTVPLNTNATLTRRDRVVLRRDVAAKTVIAVRLAGTPAASPVAPALQQNDAGQWDLPVFSFLVPPNSGTTLTGFTDDRTWVDADGTWGTYVPTWAIPGYSDNTVGNAILLGRYRRLDAHTGLLKIQFTIGSTTGGGAAPGSAPYQFSLPPGWTNGPMSSALTGYFKGSGDTGPLGAFLSSGDSKLLELRAAQNDALVGNGLLTAVNDYIIVSGFVELA